VNRTRAATAAVGIALLLAAAAPGAEQVIIPGVTISVEIARDPGALDRVAMLDWVRDSASAVAAWYGRFPVARTRLVVTPMPGRGVSGGRSWAHDGGLIRIRVGEATTGAGFARDWVLVHEMTHLALPSLPEAHEWLEEGIATYVEPLARAQAGALSAEAVWAGFVRGMPNGLPQPGDRGLDRTHTWGRTYWGGALFCLLADLEIRRRTDNRHSLQDALRAVLAHGNMETSSEIAPLLALGDRAVGVPVLSELYARQKDRPDPTDLDGLWRRMGIGTSGERILFDDSAPEADLRRALTRRTPGR
jgi:hypothetical protein